MTASQSEAMLLVGVRARRSGRRVHLGGMEVHDD